MRFALRPFTALALLLAVAGCSGGGNPSPGTFAVSLAPSALTVEQGYSTTSKITVQRDKFTSSLTYALERSDGTALPAGVTGSFSGDTLTLGVASGAGLGDYSLRLKAVGGSPAQTKTAALTLKITPPPPASFTPEQAQQIALSLWRNDDLAKHPKGSCAGCHGADFFDLARIGSTDADLVRRAKIDGATQTEAVALAQAVSQVRRKYGLKPENARSFRPFQPGGGALLPDLADPPHLKAVKRDIAFGRQLEPLLPTLFGGRVDSLEKAKKARDELLDLARGTNLAGANPQGLNVRTLPTGVVYPLWSADLHHGAGEGTLNDWLADVAHDAKPERRAEWLALQDAYLQDPSTLNFWRMYHAALDITRTPLLGTCTMDGINPALACAAAPKFNEDKFLSALIGQHMLRLEATGQLHTSDFFGRNTALPFSYLDTDPRFAFMLNRKDPANLPANLWEIGDQGRTMLEESGKTGTFRENLRKLGYPEFVQNSIDPARSEGVEQHALRLAWFWIGFTFDPSFGRIHGSNATKVGEYMVATLIDERMFIHNAFTQNMRLVAKGFLPEANAVFKTRPDRIEPVAPVFLMHYSYFIGYGRHILDKEWNESAKAGVTFPAELKAEQSALWGRFVANGFRMSLLLQAEALDAEPLRSDTKNRDFLKGFLQDTRNTDGGVRYGTLSTIKQTLAHYEPQHQAADEALLNEVRTRLGIPAPTY